MKVRLLMSAQTNQVMDMSEAKNLVLFERIFLVDKYVFKSAHYY